MTVLDIMLSSVLFETFAFDDSSAYGLAMTACRTLPGAFAPGNSLGGRSSCSGLALSAQDVGRRNETNAGGGGEGSVVAFVPAHPPRRICRLPKEEDWRQRICMT